MKKNVIEIIALCIVLVGIGVYAYLGNKSHSDMYDDLISKTDMNKENSKYDFFVAQFPKGMADQVIELQKEELPMSSYIIRCIVVEGQQPAFGGVRAKVKVKKVFKGDELHENDEIYIVNNAWNVFAEENKMYIEFKFHNIMKAGEEYLIFLNERLELSEEKYGCTYTMDEYILAPIFLCEDRENVIIENASSYIPYEKVKNNDVYFSDRDELEEYLAFKEEMLNKYK